MPLLKVEVLWQCLTPKDKLPKDHKSLHQKWTGTPTAILHESKQKANIDLIDLKIPQ